MIVLGVLVVVVAMLTVYVATRFLRYQALPTPALRAAILTSVSLLAAVLSVTEPVEVVLRGPDQVTVWLPTLLKHLGLLGCGVGVLLMGLAQRQVQRLSAELGVWAWFALSWVAVVVLHLLAGGGGWSTSVEYVQWSHSQPLLIAGMLVAYVGGLLASLGFFVVIWPLRVGSPAGRGLAIMAVGAAFAVGWCVARLEFVRRSVMDDAAPSGGDLALTKVMSVSAIALLTVGLIWSTGEADARALRHWRDFRALHRRLLAVTPEVARTSDRRLGIDSWVNDRAVEVLDAEHQIRRTAGEFTGFPTAPERVGTSELSAVAAQMGRTYSRRSS